MPAMLFGVALLVCLHDCCVVMVVHVLCVVLCCIVWRCVARIMIDLSL